MLRHTRVTPRRIRAGPGRYYGWVPVSSLPGAARPLRNPITSSHLPRRGSCGGPAAFGPD
jgi:hypothetical protein